MVVQGNRNVISYMQSNPVNSWEMEMRGVSSVVAEGLETQGVDEDKARLGTNEGRDQNRGDTVEGRARRTESLPTEEEP